MKRWRARKVPAIEDGQRKRKGLLATEDGLETLKKGEAANIITRLKHGAQVRSITSCVALAINNHDLDALREATESVG